MSYKLNICFKEKLPLFKRNFFIEEAFKHWNGLPREVVESSPMETFNKQVDVAFSALLWFTRRGSVTVGFNLGSWFSDSKSTFPVKPKMSFSRIWSKNQVYETTEGTSALCWGYSNRCLRAYPEVQLLPDVDGITGFLVGLGEVLTGWSDSMECDLGETGSENLQVWLYCHRHTGEKSQWLKHQQKGATNKQLLREHAVNWCYSFPTAGCISSLSQTHIY